MGDMADFINTECGEDESDEQPTNLFEFYVAGVQHHKLKECIEEIKEGDALILVAEPSNQYDPNAVRVEFSSLNQDRDIMLGYVPAAKGDYSSKVSAALMIMNLKCTVLEINPEAKSWERLKVAIEEIV